MKYCIDCKKIIDNRATRCRKCAGIQQSIRLSEKNSKFYIDGHTLKKNYCSCGKKINYNATKCHTCSVTKHGLYSKHNKILKLCLDCNTKISPTAERCYSCAKKEFNRLNPRPKNPKICYCIDCKKQLGNSAYYIGTKRCNSCELIRRYKLGLKNNKGRNSPNFGKIPRWKRIKYKNIWMRSTYEIGYAKYLDKNKIKWQYEPKTFDLGDITYTPDFYLPKTKEYIEIKGWFREKDKIKINDFKSKYNEEKIIILQKEDLIKLGVL